MMRVSILLGAAGLVLAACAPTSETAGQRAEASGPRECFLVSRVNGFTNGEDGQSINVTLSRSEAFQLSALGYCRDIDWANRVALEPDGAGMSLCTGDLATIVTAPLGGPPDRCRVRVTRKLSPEEARS